MPPSRENFVPLSPSRCPAGRTLYRAQRQTRYKTLPTRPHQQPNRYKTLPTRPKLPISARFTRAGRTLYRSHHHDPSRENFLPHPAPNPVQNSPNTPPPAAHPVQNSPNTPKKAHFSQFCTSRENFVPHPPPRPQQGELCTAPAAQPVQNSPRSADPSAQPVQNSPNTPRQQPNRYKTLPTHPKRPISASFARAGRTLYRFHPHAPQLGELCTASIPTTPSRENFVPHPEPIPVQNSPCSAGPGAHPVQNSPRSPTPAAHPVQNSPHTPTKAHFSPFCPSRENFVPLSPPCPPAGRTLYRSHHHDAQQGELCTAPSAKPGTKLPQHAPSHIPAANKLAQHT